MPLYALGHSEPRVPDDAFVAPTATLIGAVELGPEASVWFGAVLRGDFERISVGAGSCVQDNAVIHAAAGLPTVIGDNVTVGHGAMLEGCVVDDDASVRESLARLLAAQGWPVVSYATANEFIERQPLAAVGCLLLDYQMPGMSGLELQQHLAAYSAAPPVVFLTGHGDLEAGVQAMKLGAVDFLIKPPDADVLYEAVRKALARHAAEEARMRSREASRERLGRLSAREREVMIQVVRGRLNKQIAADLDIALQTVKQHRGRVMEKLQVGSVAELVQIYSRLEAAAERQM